MPPAQRNARGGRCRPTKPGGSRRTLAVLGVAMVGLFAFPYWYVTSRNSGQATPVQFSKINSNKRPIREGGGATASRVKT